MLFIYKKATCYRDCYLGKIDGVIVIAYICCKMIFGIVLFLNESMGIVKHIFIALSDKIKQRELMGYYGKYDS